MMEHTGQCSIRRNGAHGAMQHTGQMLVAQRVATTLSQARIIDLIRILFSGHGIPVRGLSPTVFCIGIRIYIHISRGHFSPGEGHRLRPGAFVGVDAQVRPALCHQIRTISEACRTRLHPASRDQSHTDSAKGRRTHRCSSNLGSPAGRTDPSTELVWP